MKKLILIRHAHRDKSLGADADNGLSEKGQEQVRKLKKYFKRQFKIDDTWIFFSSPKKRCIETISPLLEDQALTTVDWLEEGGNTVNKAREGLAVFQKLPHQNTVYCSHSDVLPEYTQQMIRQYLGFDKGAFGEFDFNTGRGFELVNLIQDFSFFRSKKDA